MSITYPPDIEKFVKQEVASGACSSEDELVVNALLAYREMKLRHEETRRRVEMSLEQAERGEVFAWDVNQVLEHVHRRHAGRQE